MKRRLGASVDDVKVGLAFHACHLASRAMWDETRREEAPQTALVSAGVISLARHHDALARQKGL